LINPKIEEMKKHAETLNHEFIVLNTTANNAGVFYMTEEKADEFHKMINKWMEDVGIDVVLE
jgi:hypothetical protein